MKVPVDQGQRYVRVWCPILLLSQVLAWFAVPSLEPEGFDRSTAAPWRAAQQAQIAIAGAAALVPLAAGFVLLRGGRVAVAASWSALFSLPCRILLRPASAKC